eukprot:3045114-Pleurochrysis_carterae.AAC.2
MLPALLVLCIDVNIEFESGNASPMLELAFTYLISLASERLDQSRSLIHISVWQTQMKKYHRHREHSTIFHNEAKTISINRCIAFLVSCIAMISAEC